jgi:glycosyltransferase involved in cell wall biosynthesis
VNPYGVTSAIANHLITSSNGIVAQNRRQQDLLQQVWNRASERIENPLDIPRWDAAGNCPLPGITPATPFVLWVGRADRFHKRPLEMLRVARQNPGISFVMVMNPGDSDVHDDVHSAKPTNVTIIPQVPFEQMSALMRRASLFVSTSSSSHEGLPNVFLQAAASKVPILSLETSADWLAASGSGLCFQGDVDAFSQAISDFSARRKSPEVCHYAESGRAYVEREHDAIRQASRLLEYLRGVVDAHPSMTSSPKR